MRRWNGWGDDTIHYPLPADASAFLEQRIGPATPPTDSDFAEVVARVPDSRLPDHPLVTADPACRVRHARGQSFPDWVVMRSGQIPAFPDGVAFPVTSADVRTLIDYAREVGARIIPYGGGTSVVGHINVLPGDAPILTLDMGRMNRLLRLDEQSLLATFGAGVSGPDLEAQLRSRGYTLGHSPQSFEYSTLGGWVATRSSGQQSLRYGRIEDIFVGGVLEAPGGTLRLPSFPASAAGPDLREMVLGSEGRMGVLTDVTVRVSPLPQTEIFLALFFPNWESAQTAVRAIAQAGLPLSMLRLSTPTETETTLALAGHEKMIAVLEKALSLRGVGDEKCMLMVGFTGRSSLVKMAKKATLSLAKKSGGVHVMGAAFGKQWHKNRFKSPYLRNALWEMGYAVDTLETAVPWSHVEPTLQSIETALQDALVGDDEKMHVFTHLSHMYPHGSSIYTTYLFRLADTPDETLDRWQRLKTAASEAIVAHGGTISHQHGVGTDHAPYLQAEKGKLGMAALRSLHRTFDPDGMMNPGKLLV